MIESKPSRMAKGPIIEANRRRLRLYKNFKALQLSLEDERRELADVLADAMASGWTAKELAGVLDISLSRFYQLLKKQ